ncbi:MAG TPA: ABC transporter permease [Casimicrobiaceae bacterium]|jgi:putative spermidine/putrescine transport system permease protein|nr:ABC transporter permease [Casimicrobiaceae bacterium]
MFLPPYPSVPQQALRFGYYGFCALVFIFLVVPIVAVVPLSFNSGTFLTYPLEGFSLRWYDDFFTSPRWLPALRNSVVVGIFTTAIATPLGTLAAFGLVRAQFRLKPLVVGLLISPLIVPVIITAIGIYFVYSPLGLTSSRLGLVLAHTVLATPFVVVVVHATLQGFDPALWRAALSLGAPPLAVFRKVILPLIAPGVISGAIFAFTTSFDEIVTTIFIAGPEQRTLPLQMFDGVREQISPTITAAATLLIAVSVVMLGAIEVLRRRSARIYARR